MTVLNVNVASVYKVILAGEDNRAQLKVGQRDTVSRTETHIRASTSQLNKWISRFIISILYSYPYANLLISLIQY